MDDNTLLILIEKLTRIVVPIIMFFGIIGNVLNIIILRRRHMRISSCSNNLIVLSINNLFYLSILTTYNLLLDGYEIDPSRYSPIFCKMISYFLNLIPTLSLYYIVLASIDRYCSSSINPRIRRLINDKISKYLLIMVTMILSLLMIGTLISFNLEDDGFGCTIRSNHLFNQIFLFIEVILYVLIGPFLLIFFGLLTILNITKSGEIRLRMFRHRRIERQLIRMLIVQVSAHLIFVGPFCILFLMLILPIEFRLTLRFDLIYVLCKIPFYLTFLSPFFLYILSAKIYREELIKLFSFNYRNQVHPRRNIRIVNNETHL